MKKLTTTLLVIGLILFLASLALFVYHTTATGNALSSDAIGMIEGGTLACVAVFMGSRAIAGIRILEVTDKDKAQFQELRRELNIWRVLARLVGGFGSVFYIVGMVSVFQHKKDWRLSVELITIGLVLALCTIPLARRSR